MVKYSSIEDCNLEQDRLTKNIAIAVTPEFHQRYMAVRQFMKNSGVNISENLRQAVSDELDDLESVMMRAQDKSTV